MQHHRRTTHHSRRFLSASLLWLGALIASACTTGGSERPVCGDAVRDPGEVCDLAEWSWSAVPDASFVDGYNPEYTRYLSFDLTSPAPPNSYTALP